MSPKPDSKIYTLVHKLTSTQLASWFFARTLHHIDGVFLRLTDQKATLTGILAGLPTVILTTTGAKSGLPRTVPLVGLHDPSDPSQIALIASNFGQSHHPAWYHNLTANPQATCQVDGQTDSYLAEEVHGTVYDSIWQAAEKTYLGYTKYKERAVNRHIPIMILTKVEE
jgi:deazaflavin-dependent oxidoreductase (nitroreductase family)